MEQSELKKLVIEGMGRAAQSLFSRDELTSKEFTEKLASGIVDQELLRKHVKSNEDFLAQTIASGRILEHWDVAFGVNR